MFFLILTLSLIILITGIGLLVKGMTLLGGIIIGVGVLFLFIIVAYYNSNKRWFRDCMDPCNCVVPTPDCDCGPDCNGPDCNPCS